MLCNPISPNGSPTPYGIPRHHKPPMTKPRPWLARPWGRRIVHAIYYTGYTLLSPSQPPIFHEQSHHLRPPTTSPRCWLAWLQDQGSVPSAVLGCYVPLYHLAYCTPSRVPNPHSNQPTSLALSFMETSTYSRRRV